MKVRELIDELRKHDPEAEVFTGCYKGPFFNTASVRAACIDDNGYEQDFEPKQVLVEPG